MEAVPTTPVESASGVELVAPTKVAVSIADELETTNAPDVFDVSDAPEEMLVPAAVPIAPDKDIPDGTVVVVVSEPGFTVDESETGAAAVPTAPGKDTPDGTVVATVDEPEIKVDEPRRGAATDDSDVFEEVALVVAADANVSEELVFVVAAAADVSKEIVLVVAADASWVDSVLVGSDALDVKVVVGAGELAVPGPE